MASTVPITSLFIHHHHRHHVALAARRGADAATFRLLRPCHARQLSSSGGTVTVAKGPHYSQPRPKVHRFPYSRAALEYSSSSSSSSPPRPPADGGEGDGDDGGKGVDEAMDDEVVTTEETTEARTSMSTSTSDHWDRDKRLMYFPWRHSSDPLFRFRDDPHGSIAGILGGDSGTLLVLLINGSIPLRLPPSYMWFIHAYSARLVDPNLPYWRILFDRTRWDDGLAVDFASSYRTAVAYLLSDTFRVPVEQVQAEDGSIDFDHVVIVNGGDDAPPEKGEGGRDGDRDLEGRKKDDDIIRRSLNSMLEGNLSDLYRKSPAAASAAASSAAAADDDDDPGRRRMRIRLRSEMVSTRLVNLHPIPVLTREAVERNPSLDGDELGTILGMASEARKKGAGLMDVYRYAMRELDKIPVRSWNDETGGSWDWTVVAQVEVRCRETFHVIAEDGEEDGGGSGVATRDGEYDEEECDDAIMATHLVRFEVVVTDDQGEAGRKIGNWRITDWDDLLEGNIWFCL